MIILEGFSPYYKHKTSFFAYVVKYLMMLGEKTDIVVYFILWNVSESFALRIN